MGTLESKATEQRSSTEEEAREAALDNELRAAERVYAALCLTEPYAARRVCDWAIARRDADSCKGQTDTGYGSAYGLVGAKLR